MHGNQLESKLLQPKNWTIKNAQVFSIVRASLSLARIAIFLITMVNLTHWLQQGPDKQQDKQKRYTNCSLLGAKRTPRLHGASVSGSFTVSCSVLYTRYPFSVCILIINTM